MKQLLGFGLVLILLMAFALIVLALVGNPQAQFMVSCAGRGFQNCRKWA
jgi:hypothetical protein